MLTDSGHMDPNHAGTEGESGHMDPNQAESQRQTGHTDPNPAGDWTYNEAARARDITLYISARGYLMYIRTHLSLSPNSHIVCIAILEANV